MCGLALRYLGLSLGPVDLAGVCAIVGTLVPAIIEGKIGLLVSTVPGGVVLLGFLVCLVGIALCGYAGVLKEQRLTDDQKKESIKDFALVKGIVVAVFGGIMSASMALAFTAGKPIAAASVKAGTSDVFKNMPLLVLALAGGFTTNFISTMIITAKKKAFGDYVVRPPSTLLVELFSGRHQRSDVVWAILLLRHGQDEDGRLQLRRLEHLHGRHHHLQQFLGTAAERVEAGRPADAGVLVAGHPGADRFGYHDRRRRRAGTPQLADQPTWSDTATPT